MDNKVLLLLLVVVLVIYYIKKCKDYDDEKREPFMNCASCTGKSFAECADCTNCGICTSFSGKRECMSGNMYGPYNNTDRCAEWDFYGYVEYPMWHWRGWWPRYSYAYNNFYNRMWYTPINRDATHKRQRRIH